jgi:DNA polymerase-3 subunit delta'
VSWRQIQGHDALIEAFDHAVRRGRLAHAYLFIGPPGVGKRLFAGELAKALLCEAPAGPRLEACDRCPACILVDAGTHPDLLIAGRPPESPNLPIDVVRELCRELALKPARGRRKIAILDDADDLDDPPTLHAAANAFLKTLEEPPPGSLLILVGSGSERQLPTIVSRCQIIRFAPLPATVVADLLRAQGVDDPVPIDRLVSLSGGSLGRARALADPDLWAFRRTLLEDLLRPRPDSVALARKWTEFVEAAGKEGAVQRRRAALILGLLIDFLTNALALSVGGDPHLAEPQDLERVRGLAERLGPDRLLLVLERCLEGDSQIDRRVQLVLALEALVDALGQQVSPAGGSERRK